jgi:hypothetical protein
MNMEATSTLQSAGDTLKKATKKAAPKAPAKAKPAAKPAPAAKKAKETAKPVKIINAPRADDLPATAVIRYLKDGNPAHEGSGRWKRIELLRKYDGKTIAAFEKADGNLTTLRNAMKRGDAKLEDK